ncbi:MAG: hypothetical protein KDE56_16210 [Anaerolineales bacterium]|nr:hypothetical protein [Anaerolineales bacterium]
MNLPPILFALGGMILYLLAWAGLILGYDWGKRRWRQWRMEREMARLLANNSLPNGRSLSTLLAHAPYRYDHFQGEDGYRIWDSRQPNTFVGHAATPFEAELWIVRQLVAEGWGVEGGK